MISRIANDGIEIFPTLIKQDKNFEYNNYLDDISEEGIKLIKSAMFNAVNSPNGTASNQD